MELGVRRLRLAKTWAPEVKAGAAEAPAAADAAPEAGPEAEEVGAGVALGVFFGDAAS